MCRLIPQNTQLDDVTSQHHPHDRLHLSAKPRQAQTLGFGRGCVAAPAGVLGHPGRADTRHHPPDATGRPSHFVAGNPAAPAACTQNRTAPPSADAHATTDPSTTASRASAASCSSDTQPSTTCPSAPSRGGCWAQHRAHTGHHGHAQQQSTTRTRRRNCACGPGTRCTAHAHPCQRQRCPMRQTRLP